MQSNILALRLLFFSLFVRDSLTNSQVLLIKHLYTHSHVRSAINAGPNSSPVALTDGTLLWGITTQPWLVQQLTQT